MSPQEAMREAVGVHKSTCICVSVLQNLAGLCEVAIEGSYHHVWALPEVQGGAKKSAGKEANVQVLWQDILFTIDARKTQT